MKQHTPPKRWPTRAELERIAAQVAADAGLTAADVLGARTSNACTAARSRFVYLALRDTGCSILGLATVWGVDRRSIQKFEERRRAAERQNVRLDEAA